MLFNLLQSGMDAVAVEAVPQQQEMTLSFFDLFLKGGALMWVLLALSIVAIYIFGKKWWMIRKAGQIDKNFMKDIHDFIHDGKIKSAVALCQKYDSP
ncbi:MAG: MotA/TolQ/ExbB proton channel family protein, partial [Bacteroidetes bacterium]|nr:MotA/TolQ/ExbB proton channel family protein [Candidatus Cryptobacteroides merdavium]